MTAPSYQSFKEAKAVGVDDTEITIDKPTGIVENDLMIAVIIVEQSETPVCAGWTTIKSLIQTPVSMGVFYKIAGAGEPADYTFSWTNNREAYGFIIRITGHNVSDPIKASAIDNNASDSPACPSVLTIDNTGLALFSLDFSEQWIAVTVAIKPVSGNDYLILRIFGADDDDILAEDTGEPPGTTVITIDKSSTNDPYTVCGGAAYKSQIYVRPTILATKLQEAWGW